MGVFVGARIPVIEFCISCQAWHGLETRMDTGFRAIVFEFYQLQDLARVWMDIFLTCLCS